MAEQIDNLVIDILRKIQSDISDIKTDNREQKTRIGFIKTKLAHLVTTIAQMNVQLADISVRIDRRDDNFERITRRLDLSETPLTH